MRYRFKDSYSPALVEVFNAKFVVFPGCEASSEVVDPVPERFWLRFGRG